MRFKHWVMLAGAAGAVLGSAGYMSPEQVKGGALDPRSDLFSAATVFYEMLTGRNPFSGTEAANTVAWVPVSAVVDPTPMLAAMVSMSSLSNTGTPTLASLAPTMKASAAMTRPLYCHR